MNPFSLALLFPMLPAAYHYAFLGAIEPTQTTLGWFGPYLGLAIPVALLFSAFRWTCLKAVSAVQPGHTFVRLTGILMVDVLFMVMWLACLNYGSRFQPAMPLVMLAICLFSAFVLRWFNLKMVLMMFLRSTRTWAQWIGFSRSFLVILAGCIFIQMLTQGVVVALYHNLGPVQDTLIAYCGTLYLFYAVSALSHAVQCYFVMQPYPGGTTQWVATRRPQSRCLFPAAVGRNGTARERNPR